jgi:O-antigen/teichoic acid export membrane protein
MPSSDTDDGVRTDGRSSRDIEVPIRLYKTVTVFSTLFAIAGVILGFVLLDSATNRATAELGEVNIVMAIAGLAAILGGAGVYAFATRFRAPGMGNAKDDDDEGSDNG